LVTQTIGLSEVAFIGLRVDWERAGRGDRTVQPESVPVGRAIALSYQRVMEAAQRAGQNWYDWLCDQLIAGLWQERYRQPALICYLPASPFLVYCLSPSASAQFAKLYAHLNNVVGVEETGRSYLHTQALPLLLWQPPATVVRLWPPADRRAARGERYVVDTGAPPVEWSFACEREMVEYIRNREDGVLDYTIVPDEEPSTYVSGAKNFPYMNRFYKRSWRALNPEEEAAAEEEERNDITLLTPEDIQRWQQGGSV